MIEELLKLSADQNRIAPPEDELSTLIRSIDNKGDELDESILEQVTAARMEVKQTDLNKHND